VRFSVRLGKDLRVSASRRGVRFGVGPRVMRVHVGGGRRPGISSGAGPFSIYETLGKKRRRR
jgi:hypothetical protein